MRRIYDEPFRSAVEPLRVAGAGTEAVAPLLATLVNLLRPQHVLEVGMGYTTPFLAAALAEVREQVRAESTALAAKTRGAGELDDAWLLAEPPLVSPQFHLSPYEPKLVAIDNLSLQDSSAGRVLAVLSELGLDDLVSVANCDLTAAAGALPDGFTPIDFAWVDAYECVYFFDHFWELINPDGGLVAMHYLMTYPEGEAVLRYLSRIQRANPGGMEIISLLEPHKLMQNSITFLRRRSGLADRDSLGAAGHVRYTRTLATAAATQAQLHTDRP